MPKFVVHIGPHKTGTTYLQSCFLALSHEMQSSGVLYSTDWQADRGPGHADLARRIRTGRDIVLETEFASLSKSAYETILISAENLSPLAPAHIQYLKNLIGDQQTQIVFYIRRPAELLFSTWQEGVKHGSITMHTKMVCSLMYFQPTIAIYFVCTNLLAYIRMKYFCATAW